MAQALYRRYRPQRFADVIGQGRVTVTLAQALKVGRIGHAYVFSGPRGTGKTTVARLLARAVNCEQVADGVLKSGEPCNTCAACMRAQQGSELDLIEIDAASNRGIDEIRELREKVRFAPAHGRKKVFLIDEFHMLTKEAFNALLKTLEEPPAHAIFILATTEAHAVPTTVLSRAQHFAFRALGPDDLGATIAHVAKAEHISIAPEAQALVARQADGSARDGLSLLDLLTAAANGAEITPALVRETLAIPDVRHALTWWQAIQKGDAQAGIAVLHDAIGQGSDPLELSRLLVRFTRLVVLAQVDPSLAQRVGQELTKEQHGELQQIAQAIPRALALRGATLLLNAANEVRLSSVPLLPLEVATVDLASRATPPTPRVQHVVTPTTLPAATPAPAPRAVAPQPTAAPTPKPRVTSDNIATTTALADEAQVNSVLERWSDALTKIAADNVGVAGLLKSSTVIPAAPGHVTVIVAYPFYRERLMARHNRHLVERHLEALAGRAVRFGCKLLAELTPAERTAYDTAREKAAARTVAKSQEESGREPLAQLAVDLLGGQVIE
jgi:DNA polymerase-3 subunit gamma/tau